MQRYCTIRTHYPAGYRPGPQAIRMVMPTPIVAAPPAADTTWPQAVLPALLWGVVLHYWLGLGWPVAFVIAALCAALLVGRATR